MISVVAISCLVSGASGPYPSQLDLPDDPAVRAALTRISTRTGILLPRQAWPLQRLEVSRFLSAVLARDSSSLAPADSIALADILLGPKELIRWEGAGSSVLSINARAGGELDATDSGNASNHRIGWIGERTYGGVGGELWFMSDAHIFTQWSDSYEYWDRYSLADGEPSEVPYDNRPSDGRYKSRTGSRYVAWAQWSRDWITLKYGRDRVQYGPGVWTGLTTSWNTPPYQLFDARIDPFPWLSIQATVLKAQAGEESGGIAFPGDADKWMHVHRYELRPCPGLAIAFQNQVLYKDSNGVNPAYLLPLVPLYFTQDLAGNRDNSAMQFDISWASPWGIKTWGALLVDDLNSVTDILGSNWLNRWATLVGGQVVSPWPDVDADLTVEFSQVRPWTYTGGREEAFTFAHYGLPIGSELGPDSRTWHARLSWRPWPKWEIQTEFALLEKGIGPQATLGRVHSINTALDPLVSSILSGDQWDRTSWGGKCRWSPWRDISIQAALLHAWGSRTGVADSSWWAGSLSGEVDW